MQEILAGYIGGKDEYNSTRFLPSSTQSNGKDEFIKSNLAFFLFLLRDQWSLASSSVQYLLGTQADSSFTSVLLKLAPKVSA